MTSDPLLLSAVTSDPLSGRDGEVTFLLELSYCYSYYHVRNYSSGKFL